MGILAGRSLRHLLAATGFSFMGYALLLPVVPLWVVTGGADETGAGATTGVLMLTTVLTQVSLPWLLRFMTYRTALVLGGLFLGGPVPLLVASPQLGLVLAVSAARGIGFGLVTVAGSALVAQLVSPAQRGRGLGAYGLATGLPALVCLPAGVWMARNIGYWPLFTTAAALPVLGMLPAAAMSAPTSASVAGSTNPEPDSEVFPGGSSPDTRRRPGDSSTDPSRHDTGSSAGLWPVLVGPWLAMISVALAAGGVVTFLPLVPGDAGAAAPVALFTFSAATLVFRWLAGSVGDHLGSRYLLAPALAVAAIGMLGFALATGQGRIQLAGGIAVISGAVLGIGYGATQNSSLSVMFQRVRSRYFGTVSAAWNMAFDAGTGIGAFALGAVVQQFGFAAAFVASSAFLTACVPLAVRELVRRP